MFHYCLMLKRQKRSGKWEYEKYLKELKSKNNLSILDNIESIIQLNIKMVKILTTMSMVEIATDKLEVII